MNFAFQAARFPLDSKNQISVSSTFRPKNRHTDARRTMFKISAQGAHCIIDEVTDRQTNERLKDFSPLIQNVF
jgi:hypothetical protein